MEKLTKVAKEGQRAAVFFIAQREDVLSFSPNDYTDPLFGETLRIAHRYGVEVYAFNCLVSQKGICLNQPLKVIL